MGKTPLEEYINSHVEKCLANHKASVVRDAKVVHDPIHGSNVFSREEVAIIETPFLQRLRHIAQTDVASLVYPACRHSRFDHSLGTAVIAGRISDAVKRAPECDKLISDESRLELRFAALLHDIGHGPFSHISEDMVRRLEVFRETRAAYPGFFHPDKPHEMVSYFMVVSPAFQEFLKNHIALTYKLPTVSPQRIARIIIGKMDDPNDSYLGEIINGAFDADKLDYIQRDGYFSGLKMQVDLDRLLASVWVHEEEDGRRLMFRPGAISALEQILFYKVQLYSTMYHHQKLRSAECLLRALFEIFAEENKMLLNDWTINWPFDFIRLTDGDLLFGATNNEEFRHYVSRLKNRQLLKRAMVICADSIDEPRKSGFSTLLAMGEEPARLDKLRAQLAKECGQNPRELWVDFPDLPSVSEPSRVTIREYGDQSRSRPMKDYFSTSDWLRSYGEVKWRGHIFCNDDLALREKVGECASEYFAANRDFEIVFNSLATEWARMA